jgi:transposase-like protein
MRKRVHSRETKLAALNELQAGKSVVEICREYEINANLLYRWKSDYKKDPERAFSGKGNVWTAEARIA